MEFLSQFFLLTIILNLSEEFLNHSASLKVLHYLFRTGIFLEFKKLDVLSVWSEQSLSHRIIRNTELLYVARYMITATNIQLLCRNQ